MIFPFIKVLAIQFLKTLSTKAIGVGSFNVIKAIILKKNIADNVKKLLILQIKSRIGKLNYFIDWYKFGFAETSKRYLFMRLPRTIRLPYYLFSQAKNISKSEKLLKDKFWENYNALSTSEKVNTLNQLVDYKPIANKYKRKKEELLNKPIRFYVNSPESQNFSQDWHTANLSKHFYYVPIRGILTPYRKYYRYQFSTLRTTNRIVTRAIAANDYGRQVFSLLRKPLSPAMKILIKMWYYNN